MAKFKHEDVFDFSSDVRCFRVHVCFYYSKNKSQMSSEDKRKYCDLIAKLYLLEDALQPFVNEYLLQEEDE